MIHTLGAALRCTEFKLALSLGFWLPEPAIRHLTGGPGKVGVNQIPDPTELSPRRLWTTFLEPRPGFPHISCASAPPGRLEQRRPRQSSAGLLSPGRMATRSSWRRRMRAHSLTAKCKRGAQDSATANEWEPLEFQLMTYSTGEKTNIIKKINSTTHSCSAELLGQKKKKKLAGQECSFWEGCNNISRFIAPSAFSEPVSKSWTETQDSL